MKFAKRVSGLPPYVFATMSKRIAERRARGRSGHQLRHGRPRYGRCPITWWNRSAPPRTTRRRIAIPATSACPPCARRWPTGIAPASTCCWTRTTEVLPLIGSKEGIANIALAFCDPGEVALVPDPGYPVYRYGTILADGEIVRHAAAAPSAAGCPTWTASRRRSASRPT